MSGKLTKPPTYEKGVAAGLEMAARGAECIGDNCILHEDANGRSVAREIASAIRALADQPSPAEEPKP